MVNRQETDTEYFSNDNKTMKNNVTHQTSMMYEGKNDLLGGAPPKNTKT